MIVKLRYKGESFGVDSLTDGKIYNAVEEDGMYRVIDDSGEDYLYPPEHFETVRENSHDKDRIDSEN